MPLGHPNAPRLPPFGTVSDCPMADTMQLPSPADTEFSSVVTDSPTESCCAAATTPAAASPYDAGMTLDAPRGPAGAAATFVPHTGTAPQPSTAATAATARTATKASSLPTLASRRAGQNGAFEDKLRQMALPLAPLVQLTTGEVHPRFPDTLLNFWLLTDVELESLASFYHQRTPCVWTRHYPCPVTWSSTLPLEEKRRRIGKFMGLRGCETPVKAQSEDELLEEARAARSREEDETWRGKLPWY